MEFSGVQRLANDGAGMALGSVILSVWCSFSHALTLQIRNLGAGPPAFMMHL